MWQTLLFDLLRARETSCSDACVNTLPDLIVIAGIGANHHHQTKHQLTQEMTLYLPIRLMG
jgi:hypothetical protein